MKFAFLGYGLEQDWAAMSKNEQDAMVEDCFAYDRKLLKEGHLIDDGAALKPSRTSKILRWKNGTVVVTDGPFAETKEQLGGIGLLVSPPEVIGPVPEGIRVNFYITRTAWPA